MTNNALAFRQGITEAERVALLERPAQEKVVNLIIDTDAGNEVDDAYAVTYALLSPERLNVQAIYAAPHATGKDRNTAANVEKNYEEIQKILTALGKPYSDTPIYRGSESFLSEHDGPVQSPAAEDLIRRAKEATETLYVLAIGAGTNIASAILMEPAIISRISLIWVCGMPYHWSNVNDYNAYADWRATKTIIESGVALTLLPSATVTDTFVLSTADIDQRVAPKGAIGKYLSDLYYSQQPKEELVRILCDVAGVAYFTSPYCIHTHFEHAPRIRLDPAVKKNPGEYFDKNLRYAHAMDTHLMKFAHLASDSYSIYMDFWEKLDAHAKKNKE